MISYEERCARRRAELEAALQRAVETCRSIPNVTRLIAFGSFVRGPVSPWSEIDLLVVTDGDAQPAIDALNEVGMLGDVLGVEDAESEQRLALTPLGRAIRSEGKEIYRR